VVGQRAMLVKSRMVLLANLPLRLSQLALLLGLWLAGIAGLGADDGATKVARVLAGNLVELGDGRVIRLAGIRLPSDGGELAAQAALAALVQGRAVRFEPAGQGSDRYGRLVAQVWRDDGVWLQGALLEQGLVQVQTRPGEIARAAEMAAREHAARSAGTGIWADPRFAVRPADQLDGVAGFQIVQGRVVRVAPTKRYVYLNFGADWRSDFTLRVASGLARSLKKAGLDLEALTGRDVELRGYVLEAGGPLIELSHREQIRILADAPGGAGF
jgi:endonuclease YncB( thermonuclease family)